ncbi:MAG TPA: murein biosynthesis integral membrane protein MurJ [Bosea sp. (in: a-proteobacteria)]|uniref:murein biosynthesis integral membrane protein MurJ n=1 Tax=Bosea sp. (in: a-proteobacteria) TaxID=1871050 RepID=UPI002DDD6052|nr:murein biosynthesis integral membrane protein MurJ [Bosea sp. (in: a-proteobacteria)]HEV2556752.1 murein biosynthesis integral membrane protein MurJ [Bosea sp. (in: a-proteobacteria)]
MSQARPQPSSHLARNSLVVGLATVLSRLLGFARDMLIARMLGAGPVADAFLVAFRLPNLMRRVLGEGGLNAPFVPVYLDLRSAEGVQAARRFVGEAFAWLALGVGAATGLGLLLAPWLVLAIAGGFHDAPQTLAMATAYTRIALPFLAFTTLASLLAAVLNSEGRFLVAALAPSLLNLVLIAALIVALTTGMPSAQGAALIAAAVSLGGALHLLMVAMALWHGDMPLVRPRLRWSPEMTRLLRLGGPALLAASTSQLVLLVSTQIASVQPGAVSWLYYADRVFQLPLGFVAVAMGVVLLPAIALRETSGDEAGRRDMIDRALVLGLALAIPAAIALAWLADPIISVLFERGRFTEIDRIRTADAMQAFAAGLPFAVIAKVFAQVYFARQTPRLPLYAGLAALGVAILAGQVAALPSPATNAAAAASLAFVTQACVLAGFLARDQLWRPRLALLRPVFAVITASLVMVAALAAMTPWLAESLSTQSALLRRAAALGALCCGGGLVYAAAGRLLGAFRLRDLGRLGKPL